MTSADASRPARRFPLRFVLSTLVGLALFAALARWGNIDWTDMWGKLTSIWPWTFLGALGLHALIYIARAERFRVLLPVEQRPRRAALLCVTSAHNLAVYVLPAKTGEATLPLYLKATCGIDAAESIASLIVSRLFDLAAMSTFLAAATLYVSTTDNWRFPAWIGVATGLGLAASALAFLALAARGDLLVAPFQRTLRTLRLDRTRIGAKLAGGGERLKDALRLAGHGSARPAAFGLSLAVWALIFVFYGVLSMGLGLPPGVDFLQATFGSSLVVLMNLLPINSFAGIGTQETGAVLGLGMVGVAKDVALANGLGVHAVQLFDTLLFGLVGHLAMGLARRK